MPNRIPQKKPHQEAKMDASSHGLGPDKRKWSAFPEQGWARSDRARKSSHMRFPLPPHVSPISHSQRDIFPGTIALVSFIRAH